MKKGWYILTIVFTLMFLGCNEQEKKEIARLNMENSILKSESQAKDSSINLILASLNEIEKNLAVIHQKEAGIKIKAAENGQMTPDVKNQINQDIQLINDLMLKNKKEIAWLRRQMKDSNLKIAEFQTMVDQLNTQIIEKNNQITGLNEELQKLNMDLASLNTSLDTLKNKNNVLNTTLENQTNTFNTAFYVTGTKKELLTENIIRKEGGIIGINSAAKLQQDLDESKFQKVDIRNFEEINVKSKKLELVTAHPANSYKLAKNEKGEVEKIQILNPDQFWSRSKFLVVMVN